MHIKLILTVLALFSASLVSRGIANENPYVGKWQPEMAATMAKAKMDPRFTEDDKAKMEQILPQLIGAMRMEMTPTTLTMRFGKSREQSTAYTVESVEDSEVVLTLQISESKTVGMTIRSEGEDRLSIEIEGNNDMNNYVWKPASSMEADDPNMAAIVAGAMGGTATKAKASPAKAPAASIENNLRIISRAADQYMLENGVAEASFSELDGDYFKKIEPVNGESYAELTVRAEDTEISITDQDGHTHSFKRR